jgi:predicted DNA-binding transcriptional regulator YafY
MECLIGAATAIRTNHRVRFHYQSHSDATTHREIEPYAVLHTDGRWYLIGYCLARQAVRTFRLDRATHLEISAADFHPPANFDPRQYLAQHMPFVQSDYAIDVWIDMPIEETDRSFALWRVVAESENGGTRLRCGRDRLELFAAMLLSMRRRIIVHSPAELRETFRDFATLATQAAESHHELLRAQQN